MSRKRKATVKGGARENPTAAAEKAHVELVQKTRIAGAQIYQPEQRRLIYALKYDGEIHYVTSDRRLKTTKQLAQHATITAQPTRGTRFSVQGLNAFLNEKETVNPRRLFDELASVFRDHLYFTNPSMPALLALWVMATYLFQVFMYFPYISINSAQMRCGKSLLEEILSELSYNATQVTLGATAATIYRDIHFNDSTQVLDEVESLGDNSGRATITAVLAGGFKRGGTVPRTERNESGGFDAPTEYRTFSPKVLAGIARIATILRDRSLAIRMVRKKVKCQRFDARRLEPTLQRLRDELHQFGLKYAGTIADVYASADTLPLPALDDRGRDICEPLASVARIVGADAESALHSAIEDIAARRQADDVSTEGDLNVARAVLLAKLEREATEAALKEQKQRDYIVLRSQDLLDLFKEAGLSGMEREADAQNMMHRLNLKAGPNRNPAMGGKVMSSYRIERAMLQADVASTIGVADGNDAESDEDDDEAA